jgi:hypothetical protein
MLKSSNCTVTGQRTKSPVVDMITSPKMMSTTHNEELLLLALAVGQTKLKWPFIDLYF